MGEPHIGKAPKASSPDEAFCDCCVFACFLLPFFLYYLVWCEWALGYPLMPRSQSTPKTTKESKSIYKTNNLYSNSILDLPCAQHSGMVSESVDLSWGRVFLHSRYWGEGFLRIWILDWLLSSGVLVIGMGVRLAKGHLTTLFTMGGMLCISFGTLGIFSSDADQFIPGWCLIGLSLWSLLESADALG